MSDYKPVSCQLHSELELAIIQRRKLYLTWRDEDGSEYSSWVWPRDLVVRERIEYLRVEADEGEKRDIRLDMIEGVPG